MNISKRLVAWGTDLRRNYRNDIFFRTRVRIILSLASCIGAIAFMFLVALNHATKTVMAAMVEQLETVLVTGFPDTQILTEANQQVNMVMYATIALTLLFGVLIGLVLTRLALMPVGQAFTMQKRFISGIAHELRTPLSLLRVNNELARFEQKDGSVYALLFDENIADIDRINGMLNNLLLFDRMSSRESLRFEEVNLNLLIATIIMRLRSLAEQRRITLTVTDTPIPSVMGNATALEQVFFNILKNAVMYTDPGGEVTFAYRGLAENMAIVAISDTGIGIAEKDLGHMFEPFYRTEKTGRLAGIGLAIVYEILKMHRGKVEVESVEGKGTTFVISLPLTQTEQAIPGLLGASATKIFFNFSDRTPS